MAWEMTVRDVFRFADGRTVFVGRIDAAEAFISAAVCDVVVDGETLRQIEVSEELPERRAPPEDRALSTNGEPGVTAETVHDHDLRLRES